MKTFYLTHHLYQSIGRSDPQLSSSSQKLEGVKIGKTFTKWGNLDEKLLNGVIIVKIVKLGGKN